MSVMYVWQKIVPETLTKKFFGTFITKLYNKVTMAYVIFFWYRGDYRVKTSINPFKKKGRFCEIANNCICLTSLSWPTWIILQPYYDLFQFLNRIVCVGAARTTSLRLGRESTSTQHLQEHSARHQPDSITEI